ncbi:MAG: N-formylglutamate amidohydrolase [Phycisphaeraceae bacterium]|nr:N-formylglutamate amidohydrolase [Phycisphaerales bacterium]MCB9861694.1 N-formylglutamate amidohydrolase [Phycisphaeraceae bacterium]
MSREKPIAVVLTCEHGGNEVPGAYSHLFANAQEVLLTHRGYDIGGLGVAERMSERLRVPLIASTTTRLLIDLNRSLDNPSCFSEFSRDLSESAKQEVIELFYLPYRSMVTQRIESEIRKKHRILHVSVHSFTDVLDGHVRSVDCALLFDPSRRFETEICQQWLAAMQLEDGCNLFRYNEPYKGTDDGLTTHLRTLFDDDEYAGIEIEIRQGLLHTLENQQRFGDLLSMTFARVAGIG